ncbi:hypothetical protein TNCV_3680791 [Trichonephila clavipes]|nr:hypothetical protein TNCV_3680791 [Trichonephila clavipes]
MFEKVSVLLDCPTVASEEFITVDDNNVCTAPIITGKGILELVQSSKNVIDADSGDENGKKQRSHEKYAQLFRRAFK